MRSFVLWYEPRKNQKNLEVNIEIHVNLWKKENKTETFVFDFGLMIEKIDLLEKICFYIPFKGSEWSDLGHVISSDAKLIEGIFNENCEVSTFHPKRLKVKYKVKNTQKKDNDKEDNKKRKFIVYSLSDEDIEQKEYSKGELLKLKVGNILNFLEKKENENIDEIERYYFRFRLEIEKRKTCLIKETDYNKKLFLDLFSRTETIDFRINDIRSCSEKVMEEFYRNKKFNIKKIHYLLLRNFNDEFIYNDGEINSRILEKELWQKYIQNVPEDAVAYHIKTKVKDDENIDTFCKLVRFRYEKTSWIRILGILLMTSLISLCLEKVIGYFFC